MIDAHGAGRGAAETALRVDFKSMFVVGETLIASYIVMSEPVWEAPDAINHVDGPTKIIGRCTAGAGGGNDGAAVQRVHGRAARQAERRRRDARLYRDKFVIHLPPDMLLAGSGGSLAVPLDFHFDHAQRCEVAEAELRELGRAVQQVAEAEGLELGGSDDPRPKLQQLARVRGTLKEDSSRRTVQRLLREWASRPRQRLRSRARSTSFWWRGGTCSSRRSV
jgi:hypothetical protein